MGTYVTAASLNFFGKELINRANDQDNFPRMDTERLDISISSGKARFMGEEIAKLEAERDQLKADLKRLQDLNSIGI